MKFAGFGVDGMELMAKLDGGGGSVYLWLLVSLAAGVRFSFGQGLLLEDLVDFDVAPRLPSFANSEHFKCA